MAKRKLPAAFLRSQKKAKTLGKKRTQHGLPAFLAKKAKKK